jgi:hypothetical protein
MESAHSTPANLVETQKSRVEQKPSSRIVTYARKPLQIGDLTHSMGN